MLILITLTTKVEKELVLLYVVYSEYSLHHSLSPMIETSCLNLYLFPSVIAVFTTISPCFV